MDVADDHGLTSFPQEGEREAWISSMIELGLTMADIVHFVFSLETS